MNDGDIRECLSKIIQIRFYWLSCHGIRAIFLGLLDRNITSDFAQFLKDKKYVFSKDDSEPKYPYKRFLEIHAPKGNDTPREKWLVFLRRSIILTVQAEIEELTNIKKIPLESLKLKQDEQAAFVFLREARTILFHTASKKKRTGTPVDWHVITLDNSGDLLKMKDSDLDLLLKTIITVFVENVNREKIDSLDISMALDIDIIREVNDRRKAQGKLRKQALKRGYHFNM